MNPTIVDQSAGSPYLRRMMLATWLLGICLSCWGGVLIYVFVEPPASPDEAISLHVYPEFTTNAFFSDFTKASFLLSFIFALMAKGWWLLAKNANHTEFLLYGNFYKSIPRDRALLRNRLRIELYCFLVSIAIVCTAWGCFFTARVEWSYYRYLDIKRMQLSERNLRSVATVIDNFHAMNNRYPKALSELQGINSVPATNLLDGWHHSLIYDASVDQKHYLLIARNSDGERDYREQSGHIYSRYFMDEDYSFDLVVKDGVLISTSLPLLD